MKVADAAPSGVSFVSATTSKGTCTTTARAARVHDLGLAVGESIAITINATVSSTGTKTNVVDRHRRRRPDTNPGNNTARRSTVVIAPATRRSRSPSPSPRSASTLTVTQKMLKADGKSQKITSKVTEGKKPVKGAKVTITGPGIKKSGKTNEKGNVIVTVKPSEARHHQARDQEREGLQHAADRRGRRLRAAGDRLVREDRATAGRGAAKAAPFRGAIPGRPTKRHAQGDITPSNEGCQ